MALADWQDLNCWIYKKINLPEFPCLHVAFPPYLSFYLMETIILHILHLRLFHKGLKLLSNSYAQVWTISAWCLGKPLLHLLNILSSIGWVFCHFRKQYDLYSHCGYRTKWKSSHWVHIAGIPSTWGMCFWKCSVFCLEDSHVICDGLLTDQLWSIQLTFVFFLSSLCSICMSWPTGDRWSMGSL